MTYQGIGTNLIQYCEKNAKQLGYKQVYLWTFEKNKYARKFYEKNGYLVEGKENIIQALDAKDIRYYKDLDIHATK